MGSSSKAMNRKIGIISENLGLTALPWDRSFRTAVDPSGRYYKYLYAVGNANQWRVDCFGGNDLYKFDTVDYVVFVDFCYLKSDSLIVESAKLKLFMDLRLCKNPKKRNTCIPIGWIRENAKPL